MIAVHRTGLIETGYRPDRKLSSIVSDDSLFSELANEYNEKQSNVCSNIVRKIIPFFPQHQNAGNSSSRFLSNEA